MCGQIRVSLRVVAVSPYGFKYVNVDMANGCYACKYLDSRSGNCTAVLLYVNEAYNLLFCNISLTIGLRPDRSNCPLSEYHYY